MTPRGSHKKPTQKKSQILRQIGRVRGLFFALGPVRARTAEGRYGLLGPPCRLYILFLFCGTPRGQFITEQLKCSNGRNLGSLRSEGKRLRGKTMQIAEGGAAEKNHERTGVAHFFEEMEGVRPGPFPPSSELPPPPPLIFWCIFDGQWFNFLIGRLSQQPESSGHKTTIGLQCGKPVHCIDDSYTATTLPGHCCLVVWPGSTNMQLHPPTSKLKCRGMLQKPPPTESQNRVLQDAVACFGRRCLIAP